MAMVLDGPDDGPLGSGQAGIHGEVRVSANARARVEALITDVPMIPVDPLRERADKLAARVESGDYSWQELMLFAANLIRDLLADRASLQARIRELEQELRIVSTNRDGLAECARENLERSDRALEAYEAQQDRAAAAGEYALQLERQLTAAEAREQAVRNLVVYWRERGAGTPISEPDMGDLICADELDAALASTGQPPKGA